MVKRELPLAKKCPFCGGTYVFLEKSKRHENFPYRVRCHGCWVKTDWFRTEEAVMEFWNRRYLR